MSNIINKVKDAFNRDKEPTSPTSPTANKHETTGTDSAVESGTQPRAPAFAEDEIAPDVTGPLAGGSSEDTTQRRTSREVGLDAAVHKPSAFSQKLGAAEINHSKDQTHQRRHGSISGYEHYGSGNQ